MTGSRVAVQPLLMLCEARRRQRGRDCPTPLPADLPIDRFGTGTTLIRDVVSSSESAVVTALHWPEDEDGSRDLPSAVWVCSGNSLRAVVEQVTRLDGGRTALT